MSYLVFARKYRPQTFEQVVQQTHVTQTLANAISSGRVAHAILFSGPRGTGKTTIARILAKAMNCEKGPTATPCNECRSCQEITAGSASDVFEIDGASNRGIDQVRELRDNLKYMPAFGRFKIYIIDEVHMLTKEAFNALLKTLEEPPAHVLFFFATTEIHKIPITILSRCQRHDLRRIGLEQLTSHMANLCDREGVAIDEASLDMIGREADGSVRDGLSILDQIISCSEDAVSAESVRDILGVIDRKTVFEISAALFKRDMPVVLEKIDETYACGRDIRRLYSSLVEHFRNLLVIKVGGDMEKLIDLPAHECRMMSRQAADISQTYLNQIFDLLVNGEGDMRVSTQPRMTMEMLFFRFFQSGPSLPVDVLIQKLDRLQEQQGHGAAPAPPPVEVPPRKAAPSEEPGQAPIRPSAVPAEPETTTGISETPRKYQSRWDRLISSLMEKHPSLGSSLAKCHLRSISDETMHIELEGNGFLLNRINKNKDRIGGLTSEFFGRPLKLDIVSTEKSGLDQEKKQADSNHKQNRALGHPLVADAIEVFNGKVVDVITKEEE